MTFFSRLGLLGLLLLGMLCTVSACGQKGPLYVPVKAPPVTTPYPTAKPKADLSDAKTSEPTGKN